jgi:hypothetical protein
VGQGIVAIYVVRLDAWLRAMTLETYLPAVRKIKLLGAQFSSLRTIGALLYVTILPIAVYSDRLLDVWRSGIPRAWDGTGHYGIAQIYAQSIFPDTFGWTNAYLGGMPFPNFYPPLFFWGVALLARMQLFSFLAAFKLMVVLPLLLIPAALWFCAWSLSGRDHRVAFWSALVGLYPLTSPRFGGHMQWSSGLDYFSTLSIGMYTQPLGFVLLLVWYAIYVEANRRRSRFLFSSVLLALAVLANYLNVIIATIIVAATLLVDLVRLFRNRADADARRLLLAHFFSPIVSLALTLFWVVPMLSAYDYFVTRPFSLVIVTRHMIVWFIVAAIGIVCWVRNQSSAMYSHLTTCVVLAAILVSTAIAAPRWLPLQANRLSPVLNFFLAIPVGYAVTTVYAKAKSLLLARAPRLRPIYDRVTPVIFVLILLYQIPYYYSFSQKFSVKLLNEYQSRLAFYPSYSTAALPATAMRGYGPSTLSTTLVQQRPADVASIYLFERLKEEHTDDEAIAALMKGIVDNILNFARAHADGRYAVEIAQQYRGDSAAFDSRALNSYLGAQGNQTLTVVFREASANSIFMFPQIGAISFNPDNFGFSSVLGDDLDFAEQPLAKHLARLRYLGARYLVINSDRMKERLALEPAIGARSDFGTWTIFELREPALPLVRQLTFRPALVVTSFTLKGRQANAYSYIRFAEEQFADGWFDVLLARAPTTTLDELGRLEELNQFSALILENYECDRCDLVYRQLRHFAQTRPLILFGDDSAFFNRIKYSITDFPKATVIERNNEEGDGSWLENSGASRRYGDSSQRAIWAKIRDVLEHNKVPVDPANIQGEVGQNWIQINYGGSALSMENSVPVLIGTTYHPDWRRQDSEAVYAVTPMFMLTFVRQPTSLAFARTPLERTGVWASAFTLAAILGFAGWNGARRFRPSNSLLRRFRRRET